MSVTSSRLLKVAALTLVGLALIVILMRLNQVASVRRINESLAGREKTEDGSPVRLELLINSGVEIEIRLTNLSDRELTIYPPERIYSIHFEFFDSAGDFFQPETRIAVELPKPSERNLDTIGPQETLVTQVPLKHIEDETNIDKAAFVVARYEVSEFVREALGNAEYDLRHICIFSNVGAL